jgi:uncharacterized protein YbjT (DUF2867 family)
MKLLVLGASGRCGRWLVQLAAERGHDVTAVVRPSTIFDAPPGVEIRRAEVLDVEAIAGAVRGQDGVLSCLGLRRAGSSPWAALTSPPDLTTRVARLLIESMRREEVHRLVVISAGGVGESVNQLSRSVRWLTRSGSVAVAYQDLAMMEQELTASGLDWLAVRPVTLTNGPPTGRACPVTRYGLTSVVRRADVAAWMLRQIENPPPFGQRTVLLGSGQASA